MQTWPFSGSLGFVTMSSRRRCSMCRPAFDLLRAAALDPDESAAQLENAVEEMK
jgi:hypothetical protein